MARIIIALLAWAVASACLLPDLERCRSNDDCPQGVCHTYTGRCLPQVDASIPLDGPDDPADREADGDLDGHTVNDGQPVGDRQPPWDVPPAELPPGPDLRDLPGEGPLPSDLARADERAMDMPPDLCAPQEEACDGVDNDCDGLTDEECFSCLEPPCGCNAVTNGCEPSGGCPPHMVPVPRASPVVICIDRFEAHTEGSLGSADGHDTAAVAISLPHVAPTSAISWYQAEQACLNANKTLCTRDNWYEACASGLGLVYPYGSEHQEDFCNDGPYAAQHGREVRPTGSFRLCVTPLGLYDMSGNVSEWTSTENPLQPETYINKGGSYLRDGDYLTCDYNPSQARDIKSEEIGFRCCCNLTNGDCPEG